MLPSLPPSTRTRPSTQGRVTTQITASLHPTFSKFEMNFWYHGISSNPPKLHWRSDLETNPFPIPILTRQNHFFNIPTKTAHGVFRTKLNPVWDTVASQILTSIKSRNLKYSALTTVCFSIAEEDKDEVFGPIVVWIAVPPNSANAGSLRDATPDILKILEEADVTGVVVEWYEGSIQRLGRVPSLMRVEDRTSPKFGLNHPFNAELGIARQPDDVQGTLTLLFREVKDSDGNPSDRILTLTNKHVASIDM